MAKETENKNKEGHEDNKTEEEIKSEVETQVNAAGDQAKKDAENKGLSEDDVKKEVEKARKEEKDKLYSQIESLKENFKQVQQYLEDEKKEKEQIKKDAKEKAETERKAQLSDQERMTEVLAKLEEQLNDERKERERFEKRQVEKEKKDEIRRYREALIQANKDEIIPELVLGDTKEELDNALEIAKVRFKEYAERFKAEQGQRVKQGLRSTNPDYEGLEDLELSKDLTALDRDKYLKDEDYRNQIKEEMANEYARLSGRI